LGAIDAHFVAWLLTMRLNADLLLPITKAADYAFGPPAG
jgi:hypothetical protein